MPTNEQIADVRELEQRRGELRTYQALASQLATELEGIAHQENVAKEVLDLTKDRPEDAYEHREAGERLEELRDQRATLEKRLARLQSLTAGTEAHIARLNGADARHQDKLVKMFAKLPRKRA